MSDDPQMKKALATSPIPFSVQVIFMAVDGVILMVSGGNILGGKNWARWFFTIFVALTTLFGLIFSPDRITLIPAVLLQGTFILFLFLPKADEYFSKY